MVALNSKYIQELYEYMRSGNMTLDFQFSSQDRRFEMLEFLDAVMDLGEAADKAASEMIFRGSSLGLFAGGVPDSGVDEA